MNKTGISPLIATILLVFLAAALGVLAMSWGRAQLEDAAVCPVNIGLNIIELNKEQQLCYAGKGETGVIHFLVENGPHTNISSLQFTAIGTKDVYAIEIPQSSIKKVYPLMKNIPYNFDLFGDIRQIKITPKIVLYPGEDPAICKEQSLVINDPRECR